jgi:carbon dioxide concentrating mechanism protein CcmN
MPAFIDRVISGNVQIDPSAAIAPGVIIQADPDSSIVIGAGVCIGMGVIVHAQTGKLEIGAGTNLGAGVLIVGRGEIGANCCIGACVTLVDCSLPSGKIVAAGELLENLEAIAPQIEIPDSLGENGIEPENNPTTAALNHAKAHLSKFAKKINLV